MKRILAGLAIAGGVLLVNAPIAAADHTDPFPHVEPELRSSEFRNVWESVAWTGEYNVVLSLWGTSEIYYMPGYGHAIPSWYQLGPDGERHSMARVTDFPDDAKQLYITHPFG